MKLAVDTPIYKNEDKCKFSNDCPISVLPCFSKILERLMYNRLIKFFEQNNIFYKHQYGFRKQHSTEQALITLTDKISQALDHNKHTIGIFLDLSNAFEYCEPRYFIK